MIKRYYSHDEFTNEYENGNYVLYEDHLAEIQTLRAKLEACERDAERFKKVVSVCGIYGGYWQVQIRPTNIETITTADIEERFVSDIDAAIQSSKQEGK